jgi:hypothetical protein
VSFVSWKLCCFLLTEPHDFFSLLIFWYPFAEDRLSCGCGYVLSLDSPLSELSNLGMAVGTMGIVILLDAFHCEGF